MYRFRMGIRQADDYAIYLFEQASSGNRACFVSGGPFCIHLVLVRRKLNLEDYVYINFFLVVDQQHDHSVIYIR